jgi:hemerythrin superfamily protein
MEEQMAKSNKSASGKSARANKAAGDVAGTGAAQLIKSQPGTSTSATALLAGASQPAPASGQSGQSAIEALKQDHRRVEGLFKQFEQSSDEHRKEELVAMICAELNIHTRLEEAIFYPACREAIDDEDIMDEAQVEHDAAKLLIADLSQGSSDDPFFDAKVKLLSEQIKHHVAEEEKPGQGVFAKAQEHQVDKPELATEMAELKQELQRRAARLRPTRAVSLNLDLGNLMEKSMARYSDRERGRGRYDDDDDRGGRGRGRGGWFGDAEGHSRAARERWEDDNDDRRDRSRSRYEDDDDGRDERGRFRSRSRYEDDDDDRDERGRFRSRGRYEDDDDDRDERGRFRSRSRYEDDDDERSGRGRGRGGWFGDSEGHSRSARERWEDDDDRGGRGRSRSRSRDDDDDDDRGHGRGGWFGDSRGHSQASRRGWENRR